MGKQCPSSLTAAKLRLVGQRHVGAKLETWNNEATELFCKTPNI